MIRTLIKIRERDRVWQTDIHVHVQTDIHKLTQRARDKHTHQNETDR